MQMTSISIPLCSFIGAYSFIWEYIHISFFSFFIFSFPFFQVAYQSSRGRGIWLNFWNRGSTGHRNWGCWGHGGHRGCWGHRGCRPPKPCRGCWRKRVSFSILDFLIPSFNPGLFNQLQRDNWTLHSPSQSAPSILVYQIGLIFFRVWNFKKRVQNMGCKKQDAKKGHCYSKREEAAWLLLFLNNNDPVFCTLLFATHILDPFLKFQTLKRYQVNLIN